MSKCRPKDEKFINDCKIEAKTVLSAWADEVKVWYDADPRYPWHTKHDYCLKARHSWGSAYCSWTGKREELLAALKRVGAVNIKGKVEWNYVSLAFDQRVRKEKKNEINEGD